MIPMHPVLRAMLSEIPAPDRGEYVLPETSALYLKARSALKDRVQAHFEAQKVKTIRETPGLRQRALVDVGFHSLRHSFVSLSREANAPLSVVESIVGHSNPAMTRLYTHTSEAAAGAAVASLPDITGKITVTPALPVADAGTVLKGKIRELVEKLTPKTANHVKQEILSLITAS
jgi:integrase